MAWRATENAPVITDWLAITAAMVASQSGITGAFSVARQAMQLGSIPRMRILHTSHDTIGQIYIPGINWGLALMVFGLVLAFRSSSNLAVAYGISVSGTMLIDTLLLALVARTLWPRARHGIVALCAVFFVIDLGFVVANGAKLMQGAWFPVVLGIALFTMMRTWRRGRELLRDEVRKDGIRIDTFLPGLMLAPPVRVPGTAVFLTADPTVVPHALMHNLKHNKVLHERNVFLHVETLPLPYAAAGQRLKIEPVGDEFYRIHVRFGFMETPDVPLALMRSCDHGGVYFDRWTPHSSPAARPSSPPPTAACRSGATSCSPSCTAMPPRPATSSASPATGWWNWARRWRSDGVAACGQGPQNTGSPGRLCLQSPLMNMPERLSAFSRPPASGPWSP